MSKRVIFCLCIFLFILGFLFGIHIDAKHRPNRITFQVAKNSQVNLLPRTGDVVNWVPEDPTGTGAIAVQFVGQVPCNFSMDSNGNSVCTVTTAKTTRFYGCTGNNDPNFVCADPGLGPTSATDPGHGMDFAEILAADFRGLFFLQPKQASTQQYVAPKAKPLTPVPSIVVECDGASNHNATLVDEHGLPATAITATLGSVIEWYGADDDIKFRFTDPGVCKEHSFSSSSDVNPSCTTNTVTGPNAPAKYVVTVVPSTACSGTNTITGAITILAPTTVTATASGTEAPK